MNNEIIDVKEDSIICPFCSEKIKSSAKKCKHCNEFLDESFRTSTAKVSMYEDEYQGLITDKFKPKSLEDYGPLYITILILFMLFGALIYFNSLNIITTIVMLILFFISLSINRNNLRNINKKNEIKYYDEQKKSNYDKALKEGIILKKRAKETNQKNSKLVFYSSSVIIFIILSFLVGFGINKVNFTSNKNITAPSSNASMEDDTSLKLKICKNLNGAFKGLVNDCYDLINSTHGKLLGNYLVLKGVEEAKGYYCPDFNSRKNTAQRIEYCLNLVSKNTDIQIQYQNQLAELEQEFITQQNQPSFNMNAFSQLMFNLADQFDNRRPSYNGGIPNFTNKNRLTCNAVGNPWGGGTYIPGHGWQPGTVYQNLRCD